MSNNIVNITQKLNEIKLIAKNSNPSQKIEQFADEIIEELNVLRAFSVEAVLNEIMEQVNIRLDMTRFYTPDSINPDIKKEEFDLICRRYIFIIEALRAYMCAFYGMEHPYHDIAHNSIRFDSNKEEYILDESTHVEIIRKTEE